MNRFLIALALLAASLCAPISAQTINVQHDGVPAFCATSLSPIVGSTWNFVGTCETPVPPAGTLIYGDITYIAHGAHETARNVNMTDWAQVWGRIDVTDGNHHNLVAQPWPGANGSTPQWFLPNNMQICAWFTIPSNTPMTPGQTYGAAHRFTPAGYSTGGGISIGISGTCGEIPTNGCGRTNMGAFDQGFSYRPGTGTAYNCGVPLGVQRVVTVKWTSGLPVEPNPPQPMCTHAGCKLALSHN